VHCTISIAISLSNAEKRMFVGKLLDKEKKGGVRMFKGVDWYGGIL
jgi:hypothetical protein